MASNSSSRIFSGVPDITVYLVEMANPCPGATTTPPPPQPGQMAVISHIILPYLSAWPHLGVEGWLFRGTSESRMSLYPGGQQAGV